MIADLTQVEGPDAVHIVIGPADHGVVRFGLRLAELMRQEAIHLEQAEQGTGDVLAAAGSASAVVHLQYTDGLYADRTAAAATAFVDLRRRIGAPVSVTLHDLPDPGDEPGRYRRRAESYRRVVAAVDAVAVSSRHEFDLLQQLLAAGGGSADVVAMVVPLPVEPPWIVAERDRRTPLPEVAVFGFVYPGKGHDDVIRAMAGLPASVGFTALGRTADGHDDLHTALSQLAAGSNRRLQVTGFVPDAVLESRLRQVAVPVAPARMISASGSINTWIAAGRRPLAATGPYTREFAESYPGAIQLYRPAELAGLIAERLAQPHLTWLEQPLPAHLSGARVAAGYRRLFRAVPKRVPVH